MNPCPENASKIILQTYPGLFDSDPKLETGRNILDPDPVFDLGRVNRQEAAHLNKNDTRNLPIENQQVGWTLNLN